jgi:hypothetical protein
MGKKRKGPGRPKKPKGEALGSVITVRLSKMERKAVGKAATRDGVKVSKWVRRVLLSAAHAATISEPRPEDAGIEPHGVAAPDLGM